MVFLSGNSDAGDNPNFIGILTEFLNDVGGAKPTPKRMKSRKLSTNVTVEEMREKLVPAGGQPNVLFLAIDDLNDWIGALGGHPQAKTPNLDRLLSKSVVFTNAHCAAPVCSASRHSLLSGLRPSTTGWYSNTSKSLES